jgi:hypothetical protein
MSKPKSPTELLADEFIEKLKKLAPDVDPIQTPTF